MDIFRNATIAIALVLLIFMIIILYYEFRSNTLNTKYPPYNRDCPDYSYSTDIPLGIKSEGSNRVCKFNKTFDYSKLVKTWGKAPNGESGESVPLCNNLHCLDGSNWGPCTWSSTNSSQPDEMYFISNNKGSELYNDARKCHLTYDGIV